MKISNNLTNITFGWKQLAIPLETSWWGETNKTIKIKISWIMNGINNSYF